MRAGDSAFRQDLKAKVHARLMDSMDLIQAQKMPINELRDECLRKVDMLLTEQRAPLTTVEKQQLLREVMDEIFGLGPVEQLMRDPEIADILVNGPKQIYIERMGRLEPARVQFRD
jgi:pilus assembly protein CpaF